MTTTIATARNEPAAVSRRPGPARSVLKRTFDLLLATVLLVIAAPLLILVILAVRIESRGPAIFAQRRIGYRCEEFTLYKIRTMAEGAETLEEALAERSNGTFLKLRDDPRTTRLGRLLRRTSIDELPQLWNVILGDMALVGPRPILLSDFRKMPKRDQWKRFTARPGITGLWQTSGRSLCSDARRMELDLQYVEGWSPWLDLKILLKTIPVVLHGVGAN